MYATRDTFERQNETRYGQVVLPLSVEYLIPKDNMVRFFVEEYEHLDYEKLYRDYQGSIMRRGPCRPPADPRVLYQAIVYAYANDIYSSRKIEEACRLRLDFIWLLNGEPCPDHTTIANFRSGDCKEAIEDLFYQHACYLESIGETDHEVGIIDGSKLESVANKYTFVWRGSVEKNLAKLPEKGKKIFDKYEIEEEVTKDTLRRVKSKIYGEIVALGISFIHGKGKHKSEQQKDYEELDEILKRWIAYEDQLATMGLDRNSYSKTDLDATFMRMKDDYMRNGQLKPGYNVQLCVNSEYITGIGVYNNRSDVGTLEPFMKELEKKHGTKYKSALTDAGYESLSGYRFLKVNGIECYIKPVNYEFMKTKKFKKQIGRSENMTYDKEGDFYICANQHHLVFKYEHTYTPKGRVTQTNRVYICEECTGCSVREVCCKSKDVNQPKKIEICEELTAYRNEALENLTSEYGTMLRMNRSIQVEGVFGIIKQDHHFRRFLCKRKEKVSSELFLLGTGFNIRKHYRKTMDNRLGTHLFKLKKVE